MLGQSKFCQNVKGTALLAFAMLPMGAQNRDLYPQVHALLLEAETSCAGIRLLDDQSNPHTWLGSLYAHAGYLEDAERAFAKTPGPSSGPPYDLWRAWAVYGRMDRAEQSIEAITDPESRAQSLMSLANLLWRMGQPDQARLKFAEAKNLTAKVANPAHRKQLLTSIDQASGSFPARHRSQLPPPPTAARVQRTGLAYSTLSYYCGRFQGH